MGNLTCSPECCCNPKKGKDEDSEFFQRFQAQEHCQNDPHDKAEWPNQNREQQTIYTIEKGIKPRLTAGIPKRKMGTINRTDVHSENLSTDIIDEQSMVTRKLEFKKDGPNQAAQPPSPRQEPKKALVSSFPITTRSSSIPSVRG